jgi:hypothetical protein
MIGLFDKSDSFSVVTSTGTWRDNISGRTSLIYDVLRMRKQARAVPQLILMRKWHDFLKMLNNFANTHISRKKGIVLDDR